MTQFSPPASKKPSSARRGAALSHLPAALGLALLLSACGGGDDDDSLAPPPPPGPVTRDLTVAVSGNGNVRSQPAGLDCTATCTAPFADGTSVTLTATPATGQLFSGWGGDCSGSASTCTVSLGAARNVTASFTAPAPATFSLAVSVNGGGALRSQPAGIDCGSSCSADFSAGSSVTLTPTPAAGQVFASWGGACVGAGATCTLTMSQARSASATFTAAPVQQFALAVAVTGSGSVRSTPAGIDCGSSCNANFGSGTSVALTATPAAGQRFTGWSGACTGTDACTVSMTQARSVGAAFAAAPVASAWQPPQLLETDNEFNVSDTNTFADANLLSAISPAGHAIVLWEQSDGQPNGSTRKVFSRLYVPGQGWGAAVQVPGVTTSSSLTDLVQGSLFIDANGVATWLRPNLETRRFSAAAGWGAPFLPPAQSGGLLSAAVMDGTGAIGVLISGSDVYNNALSPSGNWGSWARVDASGTLAARQATVALSANGTALAVWRQANPGDNRFSVKAARYTPSTGWQAPQDLEASTDEVPDVSFPRVAMDAAGNGIALWHQGNSVYTAVFSPTGGWGTPTQVDAGQVNANYAARLNLAMSADGRAVLAWNSGIYALRTMQYTPGSGFSTPQTLAPYSIDRTLTLDDDGNAVLIYRSPTQWPNPTSGTQNVYSHRLTWGGTWSSAALVENGAGNTKNGLAAAFNRKGQGVAAWVQNDAADSEIRNSLWVSLLR